MHEQQSKEVLIKSDLMANKSLTQLSVIGISEQATTTTTPKKFSVKSIDYGKGEDHSSQTNVNSRAHSKTSDSSRSAIKRRIK